MSLVLSVSGSRAGISGCWLRALLLPSVLRSLPLRVSSFLLQAFSVFFASFNLWALRSPSAYGNFWNACTLCTSHEKPPVLSQAIYPDSSPYYPQTQPTWAPTPGPCTLAMCPFPLAVPLPTSQESMEPRECALLLDYTLGTLKFPMQTALRLLPGLCILFPRRPMYLYLGPGRPRGNRLEGLWKCAWPPLWCKMEPGMGTKRESGQGSPVDLFSWNHTCFSLCQGTPLQLCRTGCSALPDVRMLWELAELPLPQLFSRSWPLIPVLWFLHMCLNISTTTSKLLFLPQDFLPGGYGCGGGGGEWPRSVWLFFFVFFIPLYTLETSPLLLRVARSKTWQSDFKISPLIPKGNCVESYFLQNTTSSSATLTIWHWYNIQV